ncbi:MAG TPA: hypothetical protein VLX29_07720 [Nitrospirota bacterium]|nr:hypothetical protein [Nitrospirota bacterium]
MRTETLKIVFSEPDVSKKMDSLNWGMSELSQWKMHPIATVNNGQDGKFNLTVRLLNMPKRLIGVTPSLKICPVPNEPDRCWKQDVIAPIDQNGILKCIVYLRLNISVRHVFKFMIDGSDIDVVINEKKM